MSEPRLPRETCIFTLAFLIGLMEVAIRVSLDVASRVVAFHFTFGQLYGAALPVEQVGDIFTIVARYVSPQVHSHRPLIVAVQMQYGDPSNSSRPGGAMTQANFVSNSTGTLFYLLADNSTVAALITTIDANCTSYLALSSSSSPVPYNSSDANAPQPEEAVEYYRASSVVLALNGYNNSAVFSSDANVPNSPLPSGIDTNLLNCLNQTIGVSVPLVNGAMSAWATSAGPKVSAIGMFWVLWFVLGNMM